MTHAPESLPPASVPVPQGSIEPHNGLLVAPPAGQLLYKVMSVENCLRSITGGYLHFNRVDSYADFPGADPHDGKQACCCFSLENSDYIWTNYGNGSEKGKVGLVFDFNRLRAHLNASLDPATAQLQRSNGAMCHQIFDVNYGVVEYVDWHQHQANTVHLPNPIKYIYMKDAALFNNEQELRVSLSALGIGHFVLREGADSSSHPPCRCRSISGPRSRIRPFSRFSVLLIATVPSCSQRWRSSASTQKNVRDARHRLWQQAPTFDNLDALNDWLEARRKALWRPRPKKLSTPRTLKTEIRVDQNSMEIPGQDCVEINTAARARRQLVPAAHRAAAHRRCGRPQGGRHRAPGLASAS